MEHRLIKPTRLVNNILHYTMEDAAEVLGISKKTLSRRMSARLIEYVMHGREKLLPAPAVDDYYRRRLVHTKKFLKGVERR